VRGNFVWGLKSENPEGSRGGAPVEGLGKEVLPEAKYEYNAKLMTLKIV